MLLLAGGDPVDETVAEALRASHRSLVIVANDPSQDPPRPGETRVAANLAGHGWQGWCQACSHAVLVLPIAPYDLARRGRPALAPVHAARAVEACRAMHVDRLVCVSVAGAAADAPLADLRAAHTAETLVRGLERTRWTIIRRTASFGPGDAFSGALVRQLRGRFGVAVPHPAGSVQPIAAADVADAVLAAFASGSESSTREIGGAERLSVEDLVRRAMRAVGVQRAVLRLNPRALHALLPLANRLRLVLLSREQLAVMAVGSTCADGDGNGVVHSRARYEGPVWLAERRPGAR